MWQWVDIYNPMILQQAQHKLNSGVNVGLPDRKEKYGSGSEESTTKGRFTS